MKKLIWQIILPLTIMSNTIITKWWYVISVDAPVSMMSGFPFICISDGWHTSMSYQIFTSELVGNLIIHFVFWFIAIYLMKKSIAQIKIPKTLIVINYIFVSISLGLALWIGSMPEHIYKYKREFKITILDTGYKFIWENNNRPNYSNYQIEKE